MEYTPASAVILIPSLEPDDRLPAYVRKLRERGFDIPQGIYLIEEIKREIEKILGKGGAAC